MLHRSFSHQLTATFQLFYNHADLVDQAIAVIDVTATSPDGMPLQIGQLEVTVRCAEALHSILKKKKGEGESDGE